LIFFIRKAKSPPYFYISCLFGLLT